MNMLFRFISIVILLFAVGGFKTPEVNPPNILFIAIDDMNDWAGFLNTHPQVQTPNMDALASEGISFTRAYCPAPICGPSRTAIMSGLWPTTSGIYTNDINYRNQMADHISLPEHFRNNGYHVMGVGKIFHSSASKMPVNAFDEYGGKGSSSEPFTSKELTTELQKPFHRLEKGGKEFLLPLNGIPADRHWNKANTFDWGAVNLPDTFFADTQSTNWAIERLKQKHKKPFFLALGFNRPHQPLYNPQRFHEKYPLASVVLPPFIHNDLNDVPRAGKEIALAAVTSGLHKSVEQYGEWEPAVSSYLAAISYVDELVGNVMEALQKSEYAENTLVVLWSDHGWHLGEKSHWGKATGWHRSTRIPLIIVPPKNHDYDGFHASSSSDRMVNLIDLAPTLADMSGIGSLKSWEGTSLLPLVQNPDMTWQEHTHTTFGLGNHTITTERWEYIHYFDGTSELYDLHRDPNEFVNLTNDPDYLEIKNKLADCLPGEPKWRHFIRYQNFKAAVPVEGSPIRLFNLAYQNQSNEQIDVAKDYPRIVAEIQTWILGNKLTSKYVTMKN